MKVFLTGASGFIGTHVIQKLLFRNHQVAALVRSENSMARLDSLQGCFEKVVGSLEDTSLLEDFIRVFKPESCIHLAWYVEPGEYLHSTQNILSLESSLSLFQILIKSGCKQIVSAGTCFEYDTDFGYLHDKTPTHPQSLYAATKFSCFYLGMQLATRAKIPFAWGRIFYPYGPLEDQRRLVPATIAALKNGTPFQASPGEQIRDYIHVSDVASAFCTLMEKKADGIHNISTGSPVSIRQLLETIGRLMKRPDLIQLGVLPYRNWEPPFICGDNSRLRNLGWKCRYSLEEGLSEVIEEILPKMSASRLSSSIGTNKLAFG